MRAHRGSTDGYQDADGQGFAPGKRTLTGGIAAQPKSATDGSTAAPPALAPGPAAAGPTEDPFGMHLIGEELDDDVEAEEEEEDEEETAGVMPQAARVQLKRDVQLKKKRRKKKKEKDSGPLQVIVRPNPVHLQLDKPTRVLFDTNRQPPKGATWAFTNSDPDALSVTEPVKPKKREPAEAAVTLTGHRTGDVTVGAALLPKDGPAVITDVPVTVTTKRFGSAYETIAQKWGQNAGDGLAEQLIVWGSMWDPDVVHTYRQDISIATGEQDEYTQLEAIRTLRHNVGEKLIGKVRHNPTNALESLTAFRRDARHERMMRHDDFAAYDKQLDDAISDGVKRRIKDEVKPILKKAKNVRGALLQPLTNALTADALAPYREVDESLAKHVRDGFYGAVRELFAESGERAVAICFIHAMTDVMVGHFENDRLRTEVPALANELATMAQDDKRVDDHDKLAVNLASDTALLEKTTLMDRDLHKNSVEIKYTKLYLGIRQAFQRVGDQWIQARTKGLRDDIGTVEAWQTWIGRGMNVAWAACPAVHTSAALAAGIELTGIVVDCFLGAMVAGAQQELEQRVATMRGELDRRLGAITKQLTEQAAADFAAIAKDEAAVLAISSNVFQSLTDIEQVYGDALIAELDAMGSEA